MYKSIPFLVILGLLLPACAQKTTPAEVKTLNTEAFSKQMAATGHKIVLDVRTPEEFAQNHLEGAINMDFRSDDFEKAISQLDTSAPVFVYCLSGNRSGKASALLIEKGYPTVYNMEGGMSKWTSENRAVITQEGEESKGMSDAAFNKLLEAGDSLVLVDFHAKWCAPCKKIMAYLPELEKEFQGKLKIVKVNYDDNTRLVKALGIDNVPYLFIYQNGKQIWRNGGYADKAALLKELNARK